MERRLMKGCEAIGEAAICAGARLFFGYPITPQNEIPEYLSVRLPQVGGTFVQAESEVAASNMLYGASGAGQRVFTSSSSPGISLMGEAISYMAGAELPVVIISIMRAGPGLGGILPSQSDYFQATKASGHGDHRKMALAPETVQEAADLTYKAFDLADKYRNPVIVLADGILGQMMEPVSFPKTIDPKDLPAKPWATTGAKGRERNIINSLYLNPDVLEARNWRIHQKSLDMVEDIMIDTYHLEEEVDVMIVAYGTVARITRTAIDAMRERGLRVGLFRPITVFPFPSESLAAAAGRAKAILTCELSCGQMVEDVRASVQGKVPVEFFGRVGGCLMAPDEIDEKVEGVLARNVA